MRKVGIAIALIVVLLVAAALIVPHVVNINFYHNQIQAELQKKWAGKSLWARWG